MLKKSVLSDIPQAQTFFLIVYTMTRVLRLLLQTVEYRVNPEFRCMEFLKSVKFGV